VNETSTFGGEDCRKLISHVPGYATKYYKITNKLNSYIYFEKMSSARAFNSRCQDTRCTVL